MRTKPLTKLGGETRIEVGGNDTMLELHIAGQGCGIPQEHLTKIFDELFATKPVGEGTGLGLSISRDIITNFFGGTISVESWSDRGPRSPFAFHYEVALPQPEASEDVSMPSIEDWADGSSSG